MPMVVAGLLTAFFLWVAENVGTATGTWLYPGSAEWRPVSLQKLGSWYLLLTISFVLVTIVNRPRPYGSTNGRRLDMGALTHPLALDDWSSYRGSRFKRGGGKRSDVKRAGSKNGGSA